MDKKKLYSQSNGSTAPKAKQLTAANSGEIPIKQGSLDESSSSTASATTKIIVQGNPSSTSDHVLFWLDANIHLDDDNCKRTVKNFESVMRNIHVFNDAMKCANFLHTMQNQTVFMVVSGSLGQQILPRIHHMSQLAAVLIFCSDRSKYEPLCRTYPKVRGISTDLADVCRLLKAVFEEWDEQSSDIGLISTSDISGQKIDQLDPSFMYTQLIKEVLFELEYDEKNFDEFIAYCRHEYANKDKEMSEISIFKKKYREETPIEWYTKECFLYDLVNDALRHQKSDALIKMGFYLNDLHKHIEKLYRKQKAEFSKKFVVYRGQGITQQKFEKLRKTKDGLLSFNNFLSTSKKPNIAKGFAEKALEKHPENIGIIYTITVDPSISSAPFASIEDISCIQSEKEILFSMHTVFCIIGNMKQDKDDTRLWHVQLELTSNNEPQLQRLLERMRIEIGGSSASYRLGALMIKLGKFKEAEEVYRQLFQHASDECDKANIYYQLGYIKDQQGHYDQALHFYEIALRMYRDHLPTDHPNIASCYNNMGMVYDSKKDYKKALEYYEDALKIYQKTSSSNDSNVGTCYNSIGVAYNNLGEHSKALSYCTRAIETLQNSLPSTHPSVAVAYNNIGLVYSKMKKYAEAASSYKSAIDIGKRTLPDKHPDLETYRKNLETLRNK